MSEIRWADLYCSVTLGGRVLKIPVRPGTGAPGRHGPGPAFSSPASLSVRTAEMSRAHHTARSSISAPAEPADFGLVSLSMVMIGAPTLLQNLGASAAIVQGRRDIRVVGETSLMLTMVAS